MKHAQPIFYFFLLFGFVLTTTSCEKKDSVVPDDPLALVGTWDFTKVETTAPLLGDHTDNDPTGTIIFEEGGTGEADYTFNVVSVQAAGIPSSRDDTFTWNKNGESISMTTSDGEIITWTTSNEAEMTFEATWTQAVGGLADIDYKAFLTKQE